MKMLKRTTVYKSKRRVRWKSICQITRNHQFVNLDSLNASEFHSLQSLRYSCEFRTLNTFRCTLCTFAFYNLMHFCIFNCNTTFYLINLPCKVCWNERREIWDPLTSNRILREAKLLYPDSTVERGIVKCCILSIYVKGKSLRKES